MLLVLCIGMCLGQNRRVDRLYRNYCGERDSVDGGTSPEADDELKQKIDADMRAFSDTMSYSVDHAYGVK